jgi:hypothetical protein
MSTKKIRLEKKWINIEKDWFQQASQSNACFCINKQQTSVGLSWAFCVRVDKKPIVHPLKMLPQDYYEGLWEYDVAEWFIANPITGKYIEFNLAPTGAWWMMVFDASRQRGKYDVSDLNRVETVSQIDAKSWQASLQIPVAVVEKILGRDALKQNICFILGQNPREYLSWTRFVAKQPDFHCPDEFTYFL